MLYFGPWKASLGLESFFNLEPWLEEPTHPPMPWNGMSAKLMNELDQVTHIVLHASHLQCYNQEAGMDDHDGKPNMLRQRLRLFGGLKKVSIVCGGTDCQSSFEKAGQVVLREDPKLIKGFKYLRFWNSWLKDCVQETIAYFHSNPDEEEVTNGMPTINLAAAFRIPDRYRRPIVSDYPEDFRSKDPYNHTKQPEGELYVCSALCVYTNDRF